MLIASPSGASAIIGKEFPGKFTHYGLRRKHSFRVWASEFPAFLPKEVENIKDQFARNLASRIEMLPVPVSWTKNHIMSSCVKPKTLSKTSPLVLLHGFDSSLLEWRYVLPLLEEAGLETWAFDVLGWGFSNLENLPPCNVASKRDHLYQFWNSYIRRPVTLVGPSLGAAVAIDFVVNYPQAVHVDKLIFIDASVYAEGTGNLAKLPKLMAYAGVYLLKSIPLRLYATSLTFNRLSWNTCVDWTNIGRLHCLLPWWEDATVDFMISGGYDVSSYIQHVKQKALVIWGENDQIIDSKLSVRLQCELPNAIIRQVPDCGHIPHVEKPAAVSKLITDFVQADGQVDIPAGLACLKKV
ncbi:alpha/beta hydrolase domain-containing protein VTE7 isoform X1 [Primulina tabacum]|uniref:alpha/beta hydrolase domain-containing protein VTE7 isoform X1 n=1 Tax=Primulina tabacum TaxID=48773 RepID=UPI003F59C57F